MKRIFGVWRGGEWYSWQNSAIRKRGSKKLSTTEHCLSGEQPRKWEQAPPLVSSLPLSGVCVCVCLCVCARQCVRACV